MTSTTLGVGRRPLQRVLGLGAWLVAIALVLLPATPAQAQPGPEPEVGAQGAVLWDPADDRVLFGRDESIGRPMASTTKIMTVLLALEAGTLDDTVTVSELAAAQGRIPGAATLSLQTGQRIPMRSLLAGLMLRSGNDAALAVAEHVAGSEAAFVQRMNSRAEELGLSDTRFINASGLTDDLDHHASPLDLARLAAVAMRHPEFALWAGAAQLDIPGLGTLQNRNELLGVYHGASGVKTGFTNLAGQCLVASASREGRVLYAVVLGSDDNFADAAALLEHGFTAFRRPVPLPAGAVATQYRWADAAVEIIAADTLAATLPVSARVTWRAVVTPTLDRPVATGDVVGVAMLLADDALVAEVSLVAAGRVGLPASAAPAARAGAALQEAARAFVRLQPVQRAVPMTAGGGGPPMIEGAEGRT